MAKKEDITKKSEKDLAKLLADKRASLRSFRFSIAGGKARNNKEARELRKDIARILTELRSREGVNAK